MILPSIVVPIAQTFSLLLISSSVLVSAKCYNPDGTPANNIPCTDSTPESTCCGAGYACVGQESSFFLCQPTGEEIKKPGASQFVRGTCTDKTWRSSNCPSVCVDPKRDNIAGGHGVARCPGSDRLFYCLSEGLGVGDCDTGHSLIDLVASPTLFTTVGVPTSSSNSSTATTTASTTSLSAPESTVNTKPAEGPVETSSPSSPNNSNNGTTIGIAVGVSIGALGLLAAGIFAWLLMRKRQNQQAADADTNKPSLAADGSYVSGPIEVAGNEPAFRYELPGGGMNVNPTELDSQEKRH